MIEKEQRYRISKEEKDKIYAQFVDWSEPSTVADITFGLSGATSMISNGWVIRLRQKKGKTTLEYKAALNKEFTLWEEYSIAIDSIREATKILQKIGLKEGLVLDRIRTECIYQNYKITLDDFAILGTFVEVELLDEKFDFVDVFKVLTISEREKEKPYGDIMLELLDKQPEYYQSIKDYIDNKLS
jgi:predicted adenylyl cyclase CyaB